MHYIGTASYEN